MSSFDIIANEISSNILSILRQKDATTDQKHEELTLNIGSHLREVFSWSERVQFFGMPRAEATEDSTISLTLDTIPRKFRGLKEAGKESDKIPEIALIADSQHHVLLGDPGSGKTTTLKRLARAVLLNGRHQPSREEWQLPIVLRLRDAPSATPIAKVIADALGLKCQEIQKKVERLELGENRKWYPVTVTMHVWMVGTENLEETVAQVLDDNRAIVLLDGLDEVAISQRSSLEEGIELLAKNMKKSKIIVSCRSGDYVRHLMSFDSVEICPLDFDQIETIASRWLTEQEDFLRRLRALPFQDLANKPLFLCQLIVFYRNTGYLPEQPAAVYRRIIRLSLEDWDAQRGVQRRSRYAGFDPDQKLDFLAALAYHLTYKIKTKRFSTAHLVSAYTAVCGSYSLPPAEARMVAKEIESHTGIMFESGGAHYEFSHLSLQEYLCAYYLVREPFARELGRYLAEYPAPIAVAVSLSANPSNWFAALVLNKSDWAQLRGTAVSSLLSRLVQEKPQFSNSPFLGLALLKILFLYGLAVENYVVALLASPEVQASLAEALQWYDIDLSRSDSVDYRFSLRPRNMADHDFRIDVGGTLPSDLFIRIAKRCGISLSTLVISGQSFEVVKDRITRQPE